MKEKAPYWAEKLPELPELFYDSLRQHKQLRLSVDKLANDISVQRTRQHQARYLFGVGATLLISERRCSSAGLNGTCSRRH